MVSPDTFVYAIDTWQGDEHAGNYDESVYSIVSSYCERYHRRRSSMIRSTFDEAVKYLRIQLIYSTLMVYTPTRRSSMITKHGFQK